MSYIAGSYNMKARQGSTFTETLTINIGNVPLNITGYSARMMVRAQPSSSTIILDLSSNNGKITITGVTGVITINITSSEMDTIPARSYRYDLELVNGDVVIPLLEGAFIVTPQVTR
jgi:hypothetical protein